MITCLKSKPQPPSCALSRMIHSFNTTLPINTIKQNILTAKLANFLLLHHQHIKHAQDINQSTKQNTQITQAILQLTTFPSINQLSFAKNHTSNHDDYPDNSHHQPNRRNGSHLARHPPQASSPPSRPGSQAPSSQQVSNGADRKACHGHGEVAGWPQIHLNDEDTLFFYSQSHLNGEDTLW